MAFSNHISDEDRKHLYALGKAAEAGQVDIPTEECTCGHLAATHARSTGHTPTPWHVCEYGAGAAIDIRATPKPGLDAVIAKVDGVTQAGAIAKANAAFIVLAVNSHDALLEAARVTEAKLEEVYLADADEHSDLPDLPDVSPVLAQLRAAIAAAEGRTIWK